MFVYSRSASSFSGSGFAIVCLAVFIITVKFLHAQSSPARDAYMQGLAHLEASELDEAIESLSLAIKPQTSKRLTVTCTSLRTARSRTTGSGKTRRRTSAVDRRPSTDAADRCRRGVGRRVCADCPSRFHRTICVLGKLDHLSGVDIRQTHFLHRCWARADAWAYRGRLATLCFVGRRSDRQRRSLSRSGTQEAA